MPADQKGAAGVVVPDPTANMPDGSSIRIFERLIAPDVAERTATIDNWEYFKGMLLMVAFTDHESHYIEGSAVLVAPGIAVCANHVIEPRLAQLIGAEAHPACHGITEHGLTIWNVRKYTRAPNSDLGIFALELASPLPPDDSFYQAAVTTRLPKIGEELLICGFRADKTAFPLLESDRIHAAGVVRVSKGAVTERYLDGRDRSLLPWPVLEVSCPSMGGMSGGPVFDASGRLVGLLASSLDTGDGDGVSYVSLIFPALTAETEMVWPKGLFKVPSCLLDLPLCSIERREAVRRIPKDNGLVRTEYRPWETR